MRRTNRSSSLRFYTSNIPEECKVGAIKVEDDTQRDTAREERILITGVSGRFPSANNMEEFQGKLLTGINMVSERSRRWNTKRLPPCFGFVDDYDKFDAEFFHVVPKLAQCMDPQQRKLLEVAFEAIIDAGLNPADLRGTTTGVYVGALGGQTIDYSIINGLFENYIKCQAMAFPGFMLPNRISFSFDLKGTSLLADSGCSATLVALEEAVCAIRRGTCEAAIVAGSSVLLSPNFSEAFAAMNALAPDGACKTFDNAANGFVRSEAVIAILIQKETAAKRHYATIRHIETNADGYKAEGIMSPSGKAQEALLRSAYAKSGIDPASVTYLETHGTGTPVGDPEEVHAIYNVFCRDAQRQSPLILGSVKTNIGHTEWAAGLSSVAKVITCIQSGVIPANLHFKEHNRTIRHLFGSDLEVASEPKEWKGGLIGINAFGLGGTNSHLILEPGPTTHRGQQASALSDFPVIVPFSGRTQQAVQDGLDRALDLGAKHSAVFHLLQNAFRRTIPGHRHRGFIITSPHGGAKAQATEAVALDTLEKPPLWYVFAGMWSEWPKTGKELMKFEAFAESMTESVKILRNNGLKISDIFKISTAEATSCIDGSIYTSIRHVLVANTAVQIALHDLLASIGLEPDGYVGHSMGEVLCAYADGCLSREETLLVSDALGHAILDGEHEEGSMATVELTLEDAKVRCPSNICISCHNSRTSVSISGPPEVVQDFVRSLRAEGLLAQEMNSLGFAFHNRNYAGSVPQLVHQYIMQIYPEVRLRSQKWISSSVPEENREGNPIARDCSAAYFANNLLQPVQFYAAIRHVPSNAVVLEISPTECYEVSLKESLPTCRIFSVNSSSSEGILFFLHRMGELHNLGFDVDFGSLYLRTASYPVPASVPYLSPLIRWNHEQTWPNSVVTYPKRPCRATLVLDLNDPSLSYLRGHQLGNKVVFPAAGYLTLAWKAFAEDRGKDMEDSPVTFRNVFFESATLLSPDAATATKLRFSMLDGDGNFEIMDDEASVVVASGNIKSAQPLHSPVCPKKTEDAKKENLRYLERSEAYKELRLRGYHYGGDFQGIQRISTDGGNAEVKWTNNWTTFLDAVLQTTLFSTQTRSTLVPTSINRITINPKELLTCVGTPEEAPDGSVQVMYEKYLRRVTCPGVEVSQLTCTAIPFSRQEDTLVYEKYAFSLLMNSRKRGEPLKDIVWKVTAIVMDNADATNDGIIAVEIAPDPVKSLSSLLFQALDRTLRRRTPEMTLMTLSCNAERVPDEIMNDFTIQVLMKDAESEMLEDVYADLLILHDASWLEEAAETAPNRAFILCRHRRDHYHEDIYEWTPSLRKILSLLGEDEHLYSLYRKMEQPSNFDITHIPINSSTFDWVPEVRSAMQQQRSCADSTRCRSFRMYLTSQGDPHSGILGLVKCIRREYNGDIVRAIFDPDRTLEIDFQRPTELLSTIVGDDLVTNVFKFGQRGIYCHLPVAHPPGHFLKSVTHAYVNQVRTGDLGSFQWFESPYNLHAPAETARTSTETTFCRVAYAAVNVRDVMISTGKLLLDSSHGMKDCLIGYEFSGEDYYSQTHRVMGLVSSEGLATSVTASNDLLFPVPESWSLEDAATVPLAYCMAYWALLQRHRLRAGDYVLVNGETRSVGQAAISIALSHNCKVFITVTSEDDRQYIQESFPHLKDYYIGNSWDCSFERQFMEVTKGRGVDLVLNSLGGDQQEASMRCLATDGKFLEIGDWHPSTNSFRAEVRTLMYAQYHRVSLWRVFDSATEQQRRALRENFLHGLDSGVVRPLPRKLFNTDDIEGAFRFMTTGNGVGKVLIDVGRSNGGNTESDNVCENGEIKTIRAVGRTYFNVNKTYVVIGGLGGFGLEVANWLVHRGARHLILPSRSGVTSGYQFMYLQRWKTKGVLVETPVTDLSNFEDAERFIKLVVSSGRPLGGIFNSTLVLRDNLMTEQTVKDFEAVGAPKILITKHLDALTRVHCSDLDYFVTFSSISSGLGMAAQSNYGYANSAMERLCESRVADGLHGLAIQWGPIRDIGFFEKHVFIESAASSVTHSGGSQEYIPGFGSLSIPCCLGVLDSALQHQDVEPVVLSVIMAEKEAREGQRRVNADSSGLLTIVSKMFGIRSVDRLSPTTKLNELGMDSLIAAELRLVLERDFNFRVTVEEMASITIADLKCAEAGLPAAAPMMISEEATSSEVLKKKQLRPVRDLASMFTLHEDVIIRLSPEFLKCEGDLPLIFVVHGNSGGMRETFQPLASRLRCETFCFQFGKYSDANSIHELADAYVKELRLLQPHGPYNICGYSGGGTVAFEITQILQHEYKAEVKNLIFLDGSCDFTVEGTTDKKTIMHRLLSSSVVFAGISETEKEELLQCFSQDLGDNIDKAATILSSIGDSSANTTTGSRHHLQHNIKLYLLHHFRTFSYIPSAKFCGSVTLIRAAANQLFNYEINSLQKHCHQPVSCYVVSGNHTSFLTSNYVKETAEILNKVFRPR